MDLKLINRTGGFDFVGTPTGILTVEGFETMIILALFGGSVKQSTPRTRPTGQEAFDWWGNTLLLPNEPQQQFNSQTERVLKTTAITSQGRRNLENAVKFDLEFMEDWADIDVVVEMPSLDLVRIAINLTRKSNLQSTEFVFIWDKTREDFDVDDSAQQLPPPVNNELPLELPFNL
jgi:hypothetical protein